MASAMTLTVILACAIVIYSTFEAVIAIAQARAERARRRRLSLLYPKV